MNAGLAFAETQRARRDHGFLPPPLVMCKIPRWGGSRHLPAAERTVWAHYHVEGCDWWLTELHQGTWTAYGAVNLGMDAGTEWAPFSLIELERVRADGRIVTNTDTGVMRRVPGLLIVNRDTRWEPRPWGEVDHP